MIDPKHIEANSDKETNYVLVQPNYRYEFDVIPDTPGALVVSLPFKPSLWWRITTRIFFGWKIKKI